jgi:hypothetical protein
MPTSKDEERHERIDVMLQDADLLRQQQQGSTLHAFAQADAAQPRGRFASVDATQVIASEPLVKYPAASGPWQGPDPVGPEPALGYAVHDLEPSTVPHPVEDTGGPAPDDPMSGSAVSPTSTSDRGAGSSPSSSDEGAECVSK